MEITSKEELITLLTDLQGQVANLTETVDKLQPVVDEPEEPTDEEEPTDPTDEEEPTPEEVDEIDKLLQS